MKQTNRSARRLLSYLLILAMVISSLSGLVPGTSLTAHAEGDTYTITVDGEQYAETQELPYTYSRGFEDYSSDGVVSVDESDVIAESSFDDEGNLNIEIAGPGDATVSYNYMNEGSDKVSGTISIDVEKASMIDEEGEIKEDDADNVSEDMDKQEEALVLTADNDTVPVTSVSLTPNEGVTVNKGSKITLTANVEPSNATDRKVIWSVSGTDEGAVKLYSDEACSNGVETEATDTLTVYVKGVSAGTATVTVTSNADENGSASCIVTVNEDDTDWVSITMENDTLKIGGTNWNTEGDNPARYYLPSGNYKLGSNIVTNHRIAVAQGQTVTLDIGEYNITRNQAEGDAIEVDGNLTIDGTKGEIINNNYGSCILVHGTLTLNGGTIKNNGNQNNTDRREGVNVARGTFTMNGGIIKDNTEAVRLDEDPGTFFMNGGTITGNIDGIALENADASVTLSGSANITNNTKKNVYIQYCYEAVDNR